MNRRNDARRALAVLSALLLGGAYVAYSAGRASPSRGEAVPRSPEFGIQPPPSDTHLRGTKAVIIFDEGDAKEAERRRQEILMSTSKSGRIFRPIDAPASEPPEIAPTP